MPSRRLPGFRADRERGAPPSAAGTTDRWSVAGAFQAGRIASLPVRIGIGVALAALGAAVQLAASAVLEAPPPYAAAFYPALQIAALWGGVAAILSAALASAALGALCLTPPGGAGDWLALGFYLATAILAAGGRRAPARDDPPLGGDLMEGVAAPAAPHDSRLAEPEPVIVDLTHRLSQPLAAAAAYLQTARRLMDTERAGRTRVEQTQIAEIVGKAATQVARAGRLVGHLRDFVLHGEPRLAPMRIHDLIREAQEAGRLHSQTSLRLEAKNDRALVDREQIEHALVSLLRGVEEAGVTEREMAIITFSDDTDLTVEIAGPYERVFPLASSGAPDTAAEHASFSLARMIVEAHCGTLWIERRGGDAVVAFSLPLASGAGG